MDAFIAIFFIMMFVTTCLFVTLSFQSTNQTIRYASSIGSVLGIIGLILISIDMVLF